MPKFWSLISNGKYRVGCTGQTVYIYDQNGTELVKFKDLPYAYTAAFSPKGDIFVVKSTAGRIAVYSLDEPCLIQKFRFSKVDGSQDDIFCFSPDGEWFYNIERHGKSIILLYPSIGRAISLWSGDCLRQIRRPKSAP